jgi:hypothetical protein
MALIYDGTSGITFNDGSQMGTASNLGIRNRIINGNMAIDQRNAGASVTVSATTNTYIVDRFLIYTAGASKVSGQQSSTAPAGFANSLLITSLAATTASSGDLYMFRQAIEGYNIADFNWGSVNAKTVTLSFWVRSSLTGTFGGSLTNGDVNRNYPFSYTINSANTWEQKTITIAGDQSGTWNTTNGTGIRLYFNLGSGSSFNGTAGAWATTSDVTFPSGSQSLVGTNGATLYITGVQLEKGSVATPFDFRHITKELLLCQRYYVRWKNSSTSNGLVFNPQSCPIQSATTGNIAINQALPVSMRTSATSVTTNLTNASYTTDWTMDSCFVTGNVTKTGTVGFNLTASASSVTLALTGATWSPQPNIFYITSTNGYVDISAEI